MSEGPIEVAYVEIRPRIDPAFGNKVSSSVDRAMNKVQKSTDKAFTKVAVSAEKAAQSVDESMDRISADVGRKLEATIDVDLDTSQIDRELALIETALGEVDFDVDTAAAEAALVRLGETVRIDIDDSALAQLQAALGEVDLEIDTSGFLAQAEAAIAAIDDKVTVDVDVNTAPARTAIDDLLDALPKNAKGAVDRTSAEFDRLGPALQKAVGRAEKDARFDALPDNIKATFEKAAQDVERSLAGIGDQAEDTFQRVTDGADGSGRALRRLKADGDGAGSGAISTFGQLSFILSKVAVSAGLALSAIVPVGPALAGVAAAATAVVGAAGLAAGSLITLSVSASSLLGVFAAVKVGSIGLGDAFKAQSKAQEELAQTGEISEATQQKLDAAMKNLAPSARNLVKTIGQLGDVWSEVRRRTQGALFAGSAEALQRLSDRYLPTVQRFLVGIAGDLNDFARGFADAVTSAEGMQVVARIMATIRQSLVLIVPAIGNVVAGFGILFGASMGPATALSGTILDLSERFRDFAARVSESGDFADFLNRASDAAGALLSVIGGLGRVLGGVFGAGAQAGVGLLDALGERLDSLADTIASVEGQAGLAGFFDTIAVAGQAFSDVMGAIRPILGGLGSVLTELAGPLDQLRGALLPLATAIGETLGRSLEILAPLLGDVATALVEGLAPVIEVLQTELLPLFEEQLATALPVIADLLVQLLPPLGELLAALAPLLALLSESLVPTLGAMAPVIEVITAVLVPLIKALTAVVRVLTPVIKGLLSIRKIFEVFPGVLANVGDALDEVGGFFASLGGTIGGFFAEMPGQIEDAFGTVVGFFQALPGRIASALATMAAVVGGVFSRMFTTVGGLVVAGLDAIFRFFVALPFRIVGAVLSVGVLLGQAVETWFTTVLPAIARGTLAVVEFFIDLPGRLVNALLTLPGLLATLISNAMTIVTNLITTAITNIVALFLALPGRAVTALSTLGSRVSSVIGRAATAARTAATTLVNNVFDAISKLPGKISGLGQKMFNAGKTIMQKLVNGLKSVTGVAGDIAQGIGEAVRGIMRSLVQTLNNAIPNSIAITGAPDIPLPDNPIPNPFAKGGIVDRATHALIGEAGREVVIPLTRPTRALELAKESGLFDIPQVDRYLASLRPQATTSRRTPTPAPLRAPVARSASLLDTRGIVRPTATTVVTAAPAPVIVKEGKTVNMTNNVTLLPNGDPTTHWAQLQGRLAAWAER